MFAVVTSGIITTGLLALLIGGLIFEMRRRWPDVVATLLLDADRIEARSGTVRSWAEDWPLRCAPAR